jgi:hypothetical protein
VTVVDAQVIVPKAGQIRRRKRSGRPRRSIAYTLSLLIERALYFAILGGLIVEVVRSSLGRIDEGGAPPESLQMSVTQLTAAVITVLCLVLLAKALLAFGPLYVGAPARTWLLSTPVDRAGLLIGHLAAAVAIGMVLSVTLGFVFLAVTRLAIPPAPWFTLWAALGIIETCACVLAEQDSTSVQVVYVNMKIATPPTCCRMVCASRTSRCRSVECPPISPLKNDIIRSTVASRP